MENTEQLSLEQIRAFLQASQEVRFEATQREELYGWMTRTLLQCQREAGDVAIVGLEESEQLRVGRTSLAQTGHAGTEDTLILGLPPLLA